MTTEARPVPHRPRIDLAEIWTRYVAEFLIPILAVVTALLIGAIVIHLSGASVTAAYRGLWDGAVGQQRAIAETLVAATPYILAGLGVALGFRCGLFNIGAEGQIYAGGLLSVWVGYSTWFTGWPTWLHLPLVLMVGILGGAVWGAIPGFLKARMGAHEVITTIMLNYIAFLGTDYLVKNPMLDPGASSPRTPFIAATAMLPKLFPKYRLHAGFLIALAAVVFIYWLLFKTTLGFEIRAVGANPHAARYAGMSVQRNFVLAMGISGGLAGLAGAIQIMGLEHTLRSAFSAGYGFDSIAVALLGKSHPFGIVPAAILWGGLRNGAGLVQVRAHISVDIIFIIQALVIMFVAADQIVRWLYHIRVRREGEEVVFSRGWGT